MMSEGRFFFFFFFNNVSNGVDGFSDDIQTYLNKAEQLY